MARKRMFDIDIVGNDVFLDMPLTSQTLYFHLCMHADDDGFVSPKRIMRMIGANHDDLQILIAKRYLIVFDSGIVVVKHWKKNNTIKNDRYVETTHKKEKKLLTLNEWGQYTEISKITTKVLEITDMDPNESQSGSGMDPQYSVVESSKDTNTKQLDISATNKLNSADADRKKKIPTEIINEMLSEWEYVVGMRIDDPSNRKACAALIRDMGKDKLSQLIRGVSLAVDDRYAPRISDFVTLKRKKNDLILWGRKRGVASAKAEF